MQAIALLKGPNGAANFEAKYGRNFITGSLSGGWYHAVWSFDAMTSKQKSDVKAAVDASFVHATTDVSLAAEFTKAAQVCHHLFASVPMLSFHSPAGNKLE